MIIQPMSPAAATPPFTSAPLSAEHHRLSGITALTDLGVIRATGADAASFLQGQLTQDMQMGSHEARLAAFCNAKGRMQASFVVFKRSDGDILLVCSRDILAWTVKRLSMFVLRAKVKLSDASADFQLYGLAGGAIDKIAISPGINWAKLDIDSENLVFLYPGAGVARALLCAPAGTPAPSGPPLDDQRWAWLEVQSGVAMITQPIFEALVPQMLNYESIGGVNFKKGCYPGQEVVARSQFRGTLKRRTFLAHSEGQASVGQDVFHVRDIDQPCGVVVASSANPNGGCDSLVCLQTAAADDAEGGKLTLGQVSGAALTLLPLPYPLLEDI